MNGTNRFAAPAVATRPIPVARLRDPVILAATGFGSGCARHAPGTAGTLVGVLAYLPLAQLPLGGYLVVTTGLFLAGVPLCAAAARRLGVHDHPGIVWDEVVGYLVTMTAAPAGWPWVLVGFALFRLFDIAKPWPVRVVDREVSGGLGIMLDDVVAGMFAATTLHLAAWAWGPL